MPFIRSISSCCAWPVVTARSKPSTIVKLLFIGMDNVISFNITKKVLFAQGVFYEWLNDE
jgi:hypothetical protein